MEGLEDEAGDQLLRETATDRQMAREGQKDGNLHTVQRPDVKQTEEERVDSSSSTNRGGEGNR